MAVVGTDLLLVERGGTPYKTTAAAVAALAAGGSGGSPWEEIASSNPTTNAVTFSSISSDYEDLLLLLEGVTPGTSSINLFFLVSNNGSTFTTGTQINNTTFSNTATGYGAILLMNRKGNVVTSIGNVINLTSNLAESNSNTNNFRTHRVAGGVNAIRVQWQSTAVFTAGTVRLMGRK